MRIAVSSDDGEGLESVVSPHFGRCPYYAIVDVDDQELSRVSVVENPYYAQHRPGQVPRFIHAQGVDVMLTGGMGRRAIGLFSEFGIEAVTGASGSVRRAIEQFLGGLLEGAAPCRESTVHSEETLAHGDEYEEDSAGRLRDEIQLLQKQLAEATSRLDALTAK
jgi:predicted Fe-Mo cluster-binding NifX family protein